MDAAEEIIQELQKKLRNPRMQKQLSDLQAGIQEMFSKGETVHKPSDVKNDHDDDEDDTSDDDDDDNDVTPGTWEHTANDNSSDTENEDSCDSDHDDDGEESSVENDCKDNKNSSKVPKVSSYRSSTNNIIINRRKRPAADAAGGRSAKKRSIGTGDGAQIDGMEDLNFNGLQQSKMSRELLDALHTLSRVTHSCIRIAKRPESSPQLVEAALKNVESQWSFFTLLREQ